MKYGVSAFLVVTSLASSVNWGSVDHGVTRLMVIAPVQTTNPILNTEERLIAKSRPPICPRGRACFPPPRNPSTEIYIISPCRGSLLSNNSKPILSWSAVPGATRYSVSVQLSGQPVWSQIVEERTEIPFPASVSLELDKDYELIVEAMVGNERKRGSVTFRLLDSTSAQQVEKETGAIAANTHLPAERAIKLAELYKQNELFTEAIAVLNSVKNENRTLSIYQMLGDLYLENARLPSLAEEPYKQAIVLAKNLNDMNAQAEAQVGLGTVYYYLNNSERAIDYLKAARASYETIKNPELAAQLAQFLGQVYEGVSNRDEAIRWYQIAEAEYKALGDTQRLNFVEENLRRLRQ